MTKTKTEKRRDLSKVTLHVSANAGFKASPDYRLGLFPQILLWASSFKWIYMSESDELKFGLWKNVWERSPWSWLSFQSIAFLPWESVDLLMMLTWENPRSVPWLQPGYLLGL